LTRGRDDGNAAMPGPARTATERAVLVLDADQPATLAIVRSLGRQGLAVHVASAVADPLAGRSRHVRACWRYPDPLLDEAGFIDWLATQVHKQPYTLIVPATERSVVPLMKHRHRFAAAPLALAPNEALEQVLDKRRTVALAQALGIRVPRSVDVTALDELPAAAATLGFPLVVKPARSVGADATRRVQLTVSYARDAAELQRQVGDALRYGPVILQEYFRGDGVGIELIADRGTLRYAFQHRRLHELPLTGGGSSLRVSETPVPALLEASAALVRALGWHGVAMVEFKYAAATGDHRLMEINGRFWGSLPLAVAAGADFPAMLHELYTSGQVGDWPPARAGIVGRQLARDIDWLEHVLRRAAPAGLVTLPSTASVLRDSLLVFSPRHHFDVQSWRDLRPGLVDLGRIVGRQWQRVCALAALRRQRRRETRAARDGTRQLARARHVLFLCYGNINRSALAHAYAERRHTPRFQFESAGFHAAGGRPADPTMVEVAKDCGVDLGAWGSHALTREMVERADIILAMELAHLDRLRREHPSARSKSFLLGATGAAHGSGIEVPDPYGQPRDVYQRVSRQVSAAVDAWFGTAPEAGR
jgi:protein-tyrosine-phosphatase/predicted ATP-grasp superfamily ATP-dependent carboligase